MPLCTEYSHNTNPRKALERSCQHRCKCSDRCRLYCPHWLSVHTVLVCHCKKAGLQKDSVTSGGVLTDRLTCSSLGLFSFACLPLPSIYRWSRSSMGACTNMGSAHANAGLLQGHMSIGSRTFVVSCCAGEIEILRSIEIEIEISLIDQVLAGCSRVQFL